MKSFNYIFMLLLFYIFLLGGCARQHYGNFSGLTSDQNSIIADSAVSRLSTLYPPALTKIVLKNDAKDSFGQPFINKLRDRGYSIQEFTEKNSIKNNNVTPSDNSKPSSSIDLSYIVDNLGFENYYRVTINIGQQSISRGFIADNSGKISPAGAWVRKE